MKARLAAFLLLVALPASAVAQGYMFVHPRDKTYHFVLVQSAKRSCDLSYPTVCIAPFPPDLDCDEIGYVNFAVENGDPHGFDRDRNGSGCER